ncbi:MAG TPA: hypothetical protein VM427_03430 [Patescibacteria group bacterium]|nr:hypothetical protein [Patescibacteria group bacterium]
MQVIEAGDFEIERRLDSYARARLSPDPRVVARIRARVMREARLQADLTRTTVPAASAARRTHRPRARRLSMASLAAAVWIGVAAGSIAAAQAGGPLYPARMWLEQATLPDQLAARATGELSRLDARLADALAAAARGDSGGVEAALHAYGRIADETIAEATGHVGLEHLVAAALDKHVAVLREVATRLADQANATAAGAVEASIARTIERNQGVIDRLDSTTPATGGADRVGGSASGGPPPTGREPAAPASAKSPKAAADATVKPTQHTTPSQKVTPGPTAEPTVKPTPRITSRPSPPQHTPRGTGDN